METPYFSSSFPYSFQRLDEKPKINPELLQDLHHLHVIPYRLGLFVLLYAIAFTATFSTLTMIAAPWCYLFCIPFYLLAAASLHGISLFTHEGVHHLLSSNPHWNRLLSILCTIPVLQNYSAYKVLHLKHHSHLGMQGDPDHYKNYTTWNWLVFVMYWGRLLMGYPVYITAIPILGFLQAPPKERGWITLEVALVSIFLLILACLIPHPLVIHGWLIPMVFINTMVNIRGMSQHTLLEHETDLIRGTRSILSNRITRFFMCNENYHLEHHLYPGVPWYNLPRLHTELQADLRLKGAPYIQSYLNFVSDFMVASFRQTQVGSVMIKNFKEG